MPNLRVKPIGWRHRLAAAAGAVITSVGLLAAVLGAFFLVSSNAWLPATPEVLQAAAACDGQASRAARDACRQELIARFGAASRHDTRLARAPRNASRNQTAQ